MDLPYFNKFNQMKFDTKIKSSYLDTEKSHVVVTIKGDLETYYTRYFTQAIFSLLDNEKGIKEVIFNFKVVKYISSSCVASLLNIINKAKMDEIGVYFTNCNSTVKGIIDSLGFGHLAKNIKLRK